MPTLSPVRAAVPLLAGLPDPHRGKVRDTYRLGDRKLLAYCTDGASIYDFVLNTLVPQKGMILTAMTHLLLTVLEENGIRTHLIAAGAAIDQHIPEEHRNNPLLQSMCLVVHELDMRKVEFIGRIRLTGQGLKEYNKSGTVCGVKLPEGLQDGDKLSYILDTPTTKADVGHDEFLPADEIRMQYPEETRLLSNICQILDSFTQDRGIVLADMKLEFGVYVGADGTIHVILGDEISPDSCRFWDAAEWRKSRKVEKGRKAPTSLDKQFLRFWGDGEGINDTSKFDPKKLDDAVRVHALEVPEDVIRTTTLTYRYIFWRLAGMTVEDYFEQKLGVVLPRKQKRVALVFGSQSDIPVAGLLTPEMLDGADVLASIISCHRNPLELREFAQDTDVDAIIAVGGLAFALPGVLDALLHNQEGKRIPVLGVALGQEGSQELLAAQLSISHLPGQPVVMDEITGTVYSGKEGFRAALNRVLRGELPPPKARKHRPAYTGINVDEYNKIAKGRAV